MPRFRDLVREHQDESKETLIIDIIRIVRETNFLADETRTIDEAGNVSISLSTPEEFIAYRIKSQISPFLRLARSVRRGTKPRWYEFMNKLNGNDYGDDRRVGINNMYGVNLSRENRYSPLPRGVIDTWQDNDLFQLEEDIAFFNELHDEEDALREELLEYALNEWAIPALKYALMRADYERSDKEIVSYVNRAFYTEFCRLRAESQGLKRKRIDGKWVYYLPKSDFCEDDYQNQDIMAIIFKRGDITYPTRPQRYSILTKRQFDLIDRIEIVIREDIRRNDPDYFHENYVHEKMDSKYMAEKVGMSYDAFVKNIQRIKKRVLESVQNIPISKDKGKESFVTNPYEKELPKIRDIVV